MNEEQLATIYAHLSWLRENLAGLQAVLLAAREESRHVSMTNKDEWKRTDLVQGLLNRGDDIHNALVVATAAAYRLVAYPEADPSVTQRERETRRRLGQRFDQVTE